MLQKIILFITLWTTVYGDCPFFDDIAHGDFVFEDDSDRNLTIAPSNYILKFRCDDGYTLTEPQFIYCRDDRWSDKLPNCTKKATCPDPGISDDGYRAGPCCSTGDVLKYSCKYDYQLVGDDSITCLLGGNWNSARPRCRPPTNVCPDPPSIPNGKVVFISGEKTPGDYYTAMDEVEVVCDPRFAFYGEYQFVFCDENLEWDMQFGECKETFCQRPNMPADGSIAELQSNNATKFSEGFELTYICDDGFKVYSDNVRSCRKGKWSGKKPVCEEIYCDEPNIPENGMRKGDHFGVGSRVEFRCFKPFDLLGSAERFCLPNGQWSGELARCNLRSNYCPNPGAPIKGKMIGYKFDEGDVVNFICQDGFRLIGASSRQCMLDHSWTGEETFCLGAHGFDNKNDISKILKLTLTETAKRQALETERYEMALTAVKRNYMRKRHIDLNFLGRYIFYLVFDVSGSVREVNFNASIRLAQALVKKVGVSENGARVGAVSFSSNANIQFFPGHYSTTEEVLEALGKVEYEKGTTATSLALQVVREELMPLSTEIFGERNIKTVIFLFTDGKSNTGGNPKPQGDFLKESGAEIYCIGITADNRKNELYDLASLPLDEHVFILRDYYVMDWLVQEVTNGTIDFSQCGLANERRSTAQIVGGRVAVKPWPWMAALYFRMPGTRNRSPVFQCGGSIINREWILTTAHCLVRDKIVLPIADVIIKLGLTQVDTETILQEFEAQKIVIHPQYNERDDYDIALMKLDRLIEYNQYVRPACLPPREVSEESGLYKPQKTAYVMGWRHNRLLTNSENFNSKEIGNLEELALPLQTRSVCRESLKDHHLQEMFTERMICAGSGTEEGDTCLGDSGGPLMQSQMNRDGDVYWTQIGIVSWGIGCGQINTYGFYTHVHHLLPWIDSVLNDDKNEK